MIAVMYTLVGVLINGELYLGVSISNFDGHAIYFIRQISNLNMYIMKNVFNIIPDVC